MTHLIHSVLPNPPRKIIFLSPNDSIKQCIDAMIKHNIGAVVILDKDHNLLGIVSERDIVRTSLQEGANLDTATAKDILWTEVSILSPRDTIEKAMQTMADTKRRHILVKDKSEFVAILSIGDLLYYLLDEKMREIEHLENYINS